MRRIASAGDYPRTFRLPCMGKFCQSDLFAITLSDLNEAREARTLCAYCRENGISRELATYNKLCPSAFRTGEHATSLDKLPCPEAYKLLKQWAKRFPNCDSVWLYGNTGTGKSRMIFLILYHCVLAYGYDFAVIRGGEFRQQMLNAYAEGLAKSNGIKDKLSRVEFLVFDDFGQDALTETMLSDLWQILDKRFGDGKPIAFLSNFAPADLRSRYVGFFALDSMIRRIEEFSTFIFAQKQQ